MSREADSKTYCALVLGMHRSGTSAVARFLVEMGFELPSEALPAHPLDNPGGYFESREIVELNNKILAALGTSWQGIEPLGEDKFTSDLLLEYSGKIESLLDTALERSSRIVLKDPRICRLLPIWLPVLEARFDHLAIVTILREAEAVFASLARRAEEKDIAGAAITSKEHAYALWFRYYLEAMSGYGDVQHHIVHYERWMKATGKETRLIIRFLHKTLPGIELVSRKPNLSSRNKQNPASRTGIKPAYQLLAESLCRQQTAAEKNKMVTELVPLFDLEVPAGNQVEVGPPSMAVRAAALLKHVAGFVECEPDRGNISSRFFLLLGKKPIIYISQDSGTRGHIYRVVNMIDALKRSGVEAFWLSPEVAVSSTVLKQARAVIIHRCDDQPAVRELIQYCQNRKIPVGCDLDDYLFDEEIIDKGYLNFVVNLSEHEQQVWRRRISGYQNIIRKVDFCVATTKPLKKQLERFNPNVALVPNGFSQENLLMAKHWRNQHKKRPGSKRLGYASGTPTHDADLATIAEPVAQFLQENQDWSLTLIGSLNLEKVAGKINPAQLEVRSLVEHINFAYELARLDILLVPLEANNSFCNAKSPLKWFEAALAGTPSVCVANSVFEETLSHGVDGFLCTGHEEWLQAIGDLSFGPSLRKQIVDSAAGSAKTHYRNTTFIQNVLTFL